MFGEQKPDPRENGQGGNNCRDDDDDDLTQPDESSADRPVADVPDNLEEGDESRKFPVDVELLLTAPTGKAANLLGKRANCDSYTLHQVIFSYRMKNEGRGLTL